MCYHIVNMRNPLRRESEHRYVSFLRLSKLEKTPIFRVYSGTGVTILRKEPISPAALLLEIRKAASEILDRPFTEPLNHRLFQPDKRVLALWAAACADRVLPFFTELYPDDERPAAALAVLRQWCRDGEFSMPVIRSASLSAHAAAKGKPERAAVFAAHAAGQAVAVPHVPTHAFGCSVYCIRAVIARTGDPAAGQADEKNWQLGCLRKLAGEAVVRPSIDTP